MRIEGIEAPLPVGLSAFRLICKPIRHDGLERRSDSREVEFFSFSRNFFFSFRRRPIAFGRWSDSRFPPRKGD